MGRPPLLTPYEILQVVNFIRWRTVESCAPTIREIRLYAEKIIEDRGFYTTIHGRYERLQEKKKTKISPSWFNRFKSLADSYGQKLLVRKPRSRECKRYDRTALDIAAWFKMVEDDEKQKLDDEKKATCLTDLVRLQTEGTLTGLLATGKDKDSCFDLNDGKVADGEVDFLPDDDKEEDEGDEQDDEGAGEGDEIDLFEEDSQGAGEDEVPADDDGDNTGVWW